MFHTKYVGILIHASCTSYNDLELCNQTNKCSTGDIFCVNAMLVTNSKWFISCCNLQFYATATPEILKYDCLCCHYITSDRV